MGFLGYELSLNVVAAILTITGYSVNDTIVVFDPASARTKELLRREPLDRVVNASVNQTLGRTIITATTTFLAASALYVFGGEVLRGFAFAMLVGVVTGTYSTVVHRLDDCDHPEPPRVQPAGSRRRAGARHGGRQRGARAAAQAPAQRARVLIA